MDAPTEWTYGGQLDWSSPESLKLAPIGMCLRCIVEALKERITATPRLNGYSLLWNDTSAHTFIYDDYNPFQIPFYYIENIQSLITQLLTAPVGLSNYSFCNHNDSGGDWDASSTPPPWWTETDMLSEIGTSERLELQRLNNFSTNWFFQQYQIINQFRWITTNETATTHYPETSSYYYSGFGSTISDLFSDWKKKTGTASGEVYGKSTKTLPLGLGYEAYGFPMKYCPKWGGSLLNTPHINLDASIDIYLKTGKQRTSASYYDVYSDFGEGLYEDAFAKIFSNINISAGNVVITEDVFPNINCPTDFPGGSQSEGWAVYGDTNETLNPTIIKFDGANGFKFKDW